jgi:hypothetical protein
MQTKTVALVGIASLLAVFALVAASPTIAASQTHPLQTEGQLQTGSQSLASLAKITFSSGQTITFTSTAGGYLVVGDRDINGSASGTLTLQVNGVLKGGYVVTVTGGTINIGSTSYTISGGSAEIGPYGRQVVGQGTASNSGLFLFRERSLGSFGSAQYGVLAFDLSNGSTEYGIRLLVTAATA